MEAVSKARQPLLFFIAIPSRHTITQKIRKVHFLQCTFPR